MRSWMMVPGLVLAVLAPPVSGQVPDAEAVHRACRGLDDAQKAACYDAPLQALARTGDVRAALDLLEALAERDGSVLRDGHLYVHGIGLAAWQSGSDFNTLFSRCTEMFHAGCYHGVIQAYFAAADTVDATLLDGLCAQVGGAAPDRWIRFQCVHGIGHGLTVYHEHDLLKALDGCDLLESAWNRESCYGGAFMENIGNATHPHHAELMRAQGGHGAHDAAPAFVPLRPDDPHYPCNVVKEHHRTGCYGMQTSAMLHLNGNDFAATARTCDEAPPAYREVCHSDLGRAITGYTERDPRATRRLCGMDRSLLSPWCYAGAAKAIIDWAARPEEGLEFCRGVTGEPNRMRCYEAVGEQLGVMLDTPDRRRALCLEAGSAYREACLFGARLIRTPPAGLRGGG